MGGVDAAELSATEIARRLIRIDTTSETAGEVRALEEIAGLLRQRDDWDVRLPRDSSGDVTGLLAVPRAFSGPLLLLSGHVDAVPVSASREGWTHDPFGAAIDDGWLYGRGASDMKSGLAGMVAAVLASPHGSGVALAVSRDEENGCRGTRAILEAIGDASVPIGAIIVGEPTDGLVVPGHKGNVWATVTVRGRAAHGSTPERGVNAVLRMSRLLLRADDELPRREDPYLGRETLNVGVIRGGELRNIVPDWCAADIDLRTVDPDITAVLEWWAAQPERPEVDVYARFAPVRTNPHDLWVRSLAGEVSDRPVAFGTEAGPLSEGLSVSRAVIWGPGATDCMHSAEERVRVDILEETARGYAAAVDEWGRWAAVGAGRP